MQALIVSSSLDERSLSEQLARRYVACLTADGIEARFLSLKDHLLPRFDNGDGIAASTSYRALHSLVLEADGLVLASPVYNWGCCAELKRFIEVVGTTPPDRSLRGAFFDKVVTFISAGGLPHSYMAIGSLAISMMFDFKCVINPYHVYVYEEQWRDGKLTDEASNRLDKSAAVMGELLRGLSQRTYRSDWEL
jgi:NAD(P)H-dependent FMN reductase